MAVNLDDDEDCILVEGNSVFPQLNTFISHLPLDNSKVSNSNPVYQLSQIDPSTSEVNVPSNEFANSPVNSVGLDSPSDVQTHWRSQPQAFSSTPPTAGHVFPNSTAPDVPTCSHTFTPYSLQLTPSQYTSYEVIPQLPHAPDYSTRATPIGLNTARLQTPPPESPELPEHTVSEQLPNAVVVVPPPPPDLLHSLDLEPVLVSSDGEDDVEDGEMVETLELQPQLQALTLPECPAEAETVAESPIELNSEESRHSQSQAATSEAQTPAPEATRFCFRSIAARDGWLRLMLLSATFANVAQKSEEKFLSSLKLAHIRHLPSIEKHRRSSRIKDRIDICSLMPKNMVFGSTRKHRNRKCTLRSVAQLELQRLNSAVNSDNCNHSSQKKAHKQSQEDCDYSPGTLNLSSRSLHSSLALSSDGEFPASGTGAQIQSADAPSESSCASFQSSLHSRASGPPAAVTALPLTRVPRGRPRKRARRRRSSSSLSSLSSSSKSVDSDPDYRPKSSGAPPARAPHKPSARFQTEPVDTSISCNKVPLACTSTGSSSAVSVAPSARRRGCRGRDHAHESPSTSTSSSSRVWTAAQKIRAIAAERRRAASRLSYRYAAPEISIATLSPIVIMAPAPTPIGLLPAPPSSDPVPLPISPLPIASFQLQPEPWLAVAELSQVPDSITISDSDSSDQQKEDEEDALGPPYDQAGDVYEIDETEPPAPLPLQPARPPNWPATSTFNGSVTQRVEPTASASESSAMTPRVFHSATEPRVNSSPSLSVSPSTVSALTAFSQPNPLDHSSRNVFSYLQKRFKLAPLQPPAETVHYTP